MNSNVFVVQQQNNTGGGAIGVAQAQSSSYAFTSSSTSLCRENNAVPIAELRRKKNSRSTLVGGSTMASTVNNDQRVKLERVFGMTVNSVAALACDSVNGLIAYPAGCTIVLHGAKRNRQAHIINHARKNITCVAFSPDGNYLAAAECGHQPSVRVWEVEERTQVAELQNGHNFGVSCLMFSPDMKYLISVGNQHDNVVNVWNWKNQRKSSSNKVSCKVKAISFSDDGSYFVTVGVRHVKFWYLERNRTATPKYQDTMPLQGRSAILADQRNNYFCDVACGHGAAASKTFAITQSGLLCEFNNKRLLEKWLDLKTRCAYSINVGQEHIFAGCADGVIHVFKSNGLLFVATLPRPHCLGVDLATATLNAAAVKNARYPDVVAMRYDEPRRKLTCLYNDHSLYQWEIQDDFKRVGKAYSSMAHGGCVWTVEMYPSSAPCLPLGTFFTGGSDDTIRVWNIDPNMDTTGIRKNVYSQELLKIVYADPQLTHLCDTELAVEKQENQYDGKSGIRALKTSPDGRHLATGDRSGNLRIYSVADFTLLYHLSAHDSEVLCLEYSSLQIGSYFLASSSRDRLLHVLDPIRNYEPVCTIDDHSSAITSVKFARGVFNSIRNSQHQPLADPIDQDDQQSQDDLIMLSGGADKSIIIRKMIPDQNGLQQFVRANYVALQSTVYDMDVDRQRNTVLAACQDRQIRVYHIADGKYDRAFKGSSSDDSNGTVIKLELDPSCTYVATSTNDKQTYVIDSRTGEFVAAMIGHGELVTGLKFSNDCRHLITVSGDGCVFVWRLASELTNRMLSRLARVGQATSDVSLSDRVGGGKENIDEIAGSDHDIEEKMDAQSPAWATKHGLDSGDAPSENYQQKPRGRWGDPRAPKRSEPDGLEANDGYASARGNGATTVHVQQGVAMASAGSVQKILKQFEADKDDSSTESGAKRRSQDGGGDFGSLMNVRLHGVEDDDDEKRTKNEENVIYYPSVVTKDEVTAARDFVVKERSLVGSKPYRGAETMGDMSDDDGGTTSSGDVSSALRMSESVGELHPRQHRMVLEAYEKLDSPDHHFEHNEHEQSFERGGSKRQSITSRYLQRSTESPLPAANENQLAPIPPARSRWAKDHTPVVPARILVTPSTPSPHDRSSTEIKHAKRAAVNTAASPLIDDATVSKAKLLSEAAKIQNRDRRQTFAAFDRAVMSTVAKRAAIGDSGTNADYASSELHQRSRSRTGLSPTRQSTTAEGSRGVDGDRDFDDSESNSGGVYRHRRKPPVNYFGNMVSSRSMTSLASTPTGISTFHHQQNQGGDGAMKRLNDIREKLRKSQENIAFGTAVSGATTPIEPNSPFGDWNGAGTMRSKSFGNLYAAGADPPPRKFSTPMKGGDGSSKLRTLLQSRGIALSSGNLRDQSEVTTPDGTESDRHRLPSAGGMGSTSNLVGAIMDFKKRSATDLSQATLTADERSDSAAGSFYGKVTTMPRRHAATSGVGKKAQAIRSQRFTTTSTTDRMSVSGESEDSSSIDYYNGGARSNASQSVGMPSMTRSQIITPSMRHRLDLTADANSSRSSSPSGNFQQQRAYDAARQIFEAKQRQGGQIQSPSTPLSSKSAGGRPVSSYLAKLLNSIDNEQDGGGHIAESGNSNYFNNGGRHQSESSAMSTKRLSSGSIVSGVGQSGQQLFRDRLSAVVDSCDNHFDKMSGHCKDSVNQFRTSLDKVLQAHNMVIDDTDLTEEERDELLRMLALELEAARERLNHALTQQRSASALAARRYEPEGGRDDRSAMSANGGRRHQQAQGPVLQPHAAGPAISLSGSEPKRDASVLLEEYSDMLVTLIQQKMSSTPGK